MERRGLLFVVSAPSGAGKTTLCKEILSIVPDLRHSVSYTTRKPRPGERHGREYFFVDEGEFQAMVKRNEFAEWAPVYGHLYGTPRQWLLETMQKGIDVLLDIDLNGQTQIKKQFPEAVYIYILPPSIETLRTRLLQRGSDSPEEIERRLQKAREEMQRFREYQYLIRNEDMKQALKELESIIHAERIKIAHLDVASLEKDLALKYHDTAESPGESCIAKRRLENDD